MVNLEQQETSIENNDLSIGEVALKFAKSINSGTNTRIKKARSKEFGIKNIETINVQTLTRNNPHMRMSNMSEDVKKSFYMVSLTNNTGSVLMAKQGKNIQPLAYFMDESDIDIQKVLTDSITDLSFIINSAIEETIKEGKDPYFLHLNYGWGEGYNGKYKREVYLLSAKKKWKTEEAKNIYGRIYTHDTYYFSYARENEKNW